MGEWILILTIYVGVGTISDGKSGGPTITSIEFNSQVACLSAGTKWLDRINKGFVFTTGNGRSFKQLDALCVPK